MIKRMIRTILRTCGFEIHRVYYGVFNGLQYESVIPYTSYAPWRADEKFQAVHEKIIHNTLVDIYRCYELWQLIDQCPTEGDLLEVGVWRGGTGALLAARARDVAPSAQVFLCDTFEGVVKSS